MRAVAGRGVAFALALVATGCGTAPAVQVLTSANGYAYYQARYQEACVEAVGPSGCDSEFRSLNRWRARLDEAHVALTRGGKLPLQLAELKRIEKETKKCRPR